MKFTLNVLEKNHETEKRWPAYVFGGRMRTSTVVLLIAFFAVWWLYDTNRPEPAPSAPPPTQVVPPGFVPDPDYTWVPRSRVQEPTYTAPRPTPFTTTPRTTPPPPPTTTTTTTTTPPPPFQLPCIPPFCTPTTTPPTTTSPLPQPGPGPVPTPSAPAA